MVRGLKITEYHRRILSWLVEGRSIKEIAGSEECSYQNLYKIVKRLEKGGFVTSRKVGRVIEHNLTQVGVKELNKLSKGAQKVEQQKIRVHDIWVSLNILQKSKKWTEQFVEKILEERSITYTPNKMRNWTGFYFDFAPVQVRVTPNKVMIHPPEIEIVISEEVEYAKNAILSYINDVVPRIERLFNISLTKPRKISVTVSSQHIAFVKNALAKYFLVNNIGLRIYDEEGRLRLIVDKSKENDELECIDKGFAEEDAEKLQTFISDVVFGKFDHRKLQADAVETKEILRKIDTNQQQSNEKFDRMVETLNFWSEHLKSHVTVVQQIPEAVRRGVQEALLESKQSLPSKFLKFFTAVKNILQRPEGGKNGRDSIKS